MAAIGIQRVREIVPRVARRLEITTRDVFSSLLSQLIDQRAISRSIKPDVPPKRGSRYVSSHATVWIIFWANVYKTIDSFDKSSLFFSFVVDTRTRVVCVQFMFFILKKEKIYGWSRMKESWRDVRQIWIDWTGFNNVSMKFSSEPPLSPTCIPFFAGWSELAGERR